MTKRKQAVIVAVAAMLLAPCGDGTSPIQVASVQVSPASATLTSIGDTTRFTAVARDASGNVIPDASFTWNSSNRSAATVDGDGLVTAVAGGVAMITATLSGVSGWAEVTVALPGPLAWPIDCVPGQTCSASIGYPDIDGDGTAFNCGQPGYTGHQGTDISMTWSQMDAGVDVLAAADGTVLWVFDGKYDRCPNATEPDCQAPGSPLSPGMNEGHTVCTGLGDYCGIGTCCCFWCFAGGNVVVIRHSGIPGVFATRYDHFKRNSIVVSPGQTVQQGEKIGEAGSAGNSSGPHLHFEVWGTGFYELADPWAGPCGPNQAGALWQHDPPWEAP